jgi:hypothetical protein
MMAQRRSAAHGRCAQQPTSQFSLENQLVEFSV